MATPQNSGKTAVRPNETALAPSINDTTNPTYTADPQLSAAVSEAGEHPERAAELAAEHNVGEGLWFSAEEVANLRRAAWAHGMWTDGTDPAIEKLLGDPEEDEEQVSSEDDDDGIEDVLTVGQRQPILHSPHAEAIRYLARWRDREEIRNIHGEAFPYGDQICEHYTFLTSSPDFHKFLRKAIEPVTHSEDKNWNIAWFGAEMLAAGILIARREFGRRAPTPYDLELNQGANLTTGSENLKRLARGLPELEGGGSGWRTPRRTGMQQLVDLFRERVDCDSLPDQALLRGGFWTQNEIDEARVIIRNERAAVNANSNGGAR